MTVDYQNLHISRSGYTGGLTLLALSFLNYFFYTDISAFLGVYLTLEERLCSMVALTCLAMLLHELAAAGTRAAVGTQTAAVTGGTKILASSLYRYAIYLLLIYIPYWVVSNHYYFQHQGFANTRLLYTCLVYLYLILGLPYIYLTLKYRGEKKYEFNDYGILFLLSFKTLWYSMLFLLRKKAHFSRQSRSIIKNRRITKVYLVFLVNFFFLTLMSKFIVNEYYGFENALDKIMSANFLSQTFFVQYHTVYLMLFHLIFVIDVGLAIIGYTVASRWLDNRTKTVDMTLYGWFVVLLCYPPMNSGFTDRFLGYGRVSDQLIITSEPVLMVIMALILCCFLIYVWATAALGFKFSNLTNRGVIAHGPYAYLRHPAYMSKNLAWWLDNTYVFSNIWAALALAAWNLIYIARGITEEKHLGKDNNYRNYQKKVRWRFIPFVY